MTVVSPDRLPVSPFAAAVAAVIEAGAVAARRGWVPATSGNFSVRVDAATAAVTRSGTDKGRLGDADVLVQPLDALPVPGSSAETALHLALYRAEPSIGAIFHTHSPAASVIGLAHLADGALRLRGWELAKALAGVKSHETTIEVPVFANDQDVASLARRVAERLARSPVDAVRAPGYLLAGHGLYAWGASAAEADRHLEALETLFAQEIAFRQIAGHPAAPSLTRSAS